MPRWLPGLIAANETPKLMKLSVAICTWNRSDLLRTTLQSLTRMIDAGPWELILVDNNSTDDTQAVIDSFRDALPLQAVVEPEQGHSPGRNRAAAESGGEFIVWTDDDVEVSPGWLSGYRAAIGDHPEASFFGGPIEPRYLAEKPRWLSENSDICDGVYARRQLGPDPILLNADCLPYGANFAVRRTVQRQFPFHRRFGRVAAGVRGYDEIDVLTRMLQAGHCGFWVPGAALHHLIPASRMTRRYVRDYFFGQGQTWIDRGICRPTVHELRHRIRQHQIAYWRGHLSRSTSSWFAHLVQLANLQGQLDQMQRLATDSTAGISVGRL